MKQDLTKKTTDLKKRLKKQPAIIREFSDFINRGNVVDLAVGVIIGAAFGKIVSSLVNDIIMPLVGLLAGGISFTSLEITIPNFFGGTDAAHIAYGNFIQNVVDFLIIAFCVFIFVRLVNKFARKKSAETEATETASKKEQSSDKEIISLLKDIRSELKKQK